jgi:serine/threonine protein kinase
MLGSPGCGRQLALNPGDVIDGRYVLRERIGQGGMGGVFVADQLALDRSVAIKLLQPGLVGVPDLIRRMHDEATLASHVRSPHCVGVFDWGVLPDGTPYIVMEYIPGRSLARIIADEAISLERALDLFDQILSALAATHCSGIVHGDVKSDNFLVERVNGTEHVTMIDFGLARITGAPSDVADELTISGTPEYMAPEVAAGDRPLAASDLYGGGVILYELLTGTTPFRGGTATEIMVRQARDPVIPPSECRPDRGISPEIDRVVLEALGKRPDARFADAAAFARKLRAAAGALCNSRRQPALHDEVLQPSPAEDGSPPKPRRRPARGSDCTGAIHGDTEALRHVIAAALRRGDVTAIAGGYLELANALVEGRQVVQAAAELQEGIDVLTAGCDPRANDTPPSVDPLIVALAALYDEAGDARHARSLATSTDRSPTWTYTVG